MLRFSLVSAGSIVLLTAVALIASSDMPAGNPAQWSGHEVYEILHKSPWSKTVKVSHSDKNLASDNGPAAPPSNAASMPRMGGRRGTGGSYSSGNRSAGSTNNSAPYFSSVAQVMIQWQSALPVRIAAAKNDFGDPSAVVKEPSKDYVIAVVGLPLADVGGHSSSMDSSATTDGEETQRIEHRLQNGASLLRSGHQPQSPTSVELDQGKDGRILFHFSKTDPITSNEKTVEFKLAAGGTKLEAKFVLKDMEYQGRLDL